MIERAHTWALVVRTRNRATVTARCVRAAISQTLSPIEIIVVDASDNLTETRDSIARMCGAIPPSIRYLHVAAEIRSITHQLDQGIRLASADVVFSIDDDSIMYPTAAEEVMRVYQSAEDPGAVAAVGLTGVSTPPDEAAPSVEATTPPAPPSLLRRLRDRFDSLKDRFLPYEGWRVLRMPDGVAVNTATPTQSLMGWQTTSRREYALLEPPCRYLFAGKIEAVDFTYRLGRHGAVLHARNAKVCHLMSDPGRRSRRTHGVLQILSMAILTRCYNPRKTVPASFLIRRLLSDLIADTVSRRWRLPQFRGACRGAYLAIAIRFIPDSRFQDWCRTNCWRELVVLKPGQALDRKRFA